MKSSSQPKKCSLVSFKPNKKPSNKKKNKQNSSKPKEEDPRHTQELALNRSVPIPIQKELSLEYVHFTCPWTVLKKLNASDLGGQSRLLIPKADVKTHILPLMSNRMIMEILSQEGMRVIVCDVDTFSDHSLMFKFWLSSGTFVLNGNWVDMFVIRRGLKIGDEIGLFWNPYEHKFFFTVLKKGDSSDGFKISVSIREILLS